MKTYRGARTQAGYVVTVEGKPLDPRVDLKRPSSASFEWGYEGTGPSRLALAILADHFGDDSKALNLHQDFMQAVIAEIRGDEWSLTGERIDHAIEQAAVIPMDLKTLLERVRGSRRR